MMTDQDRLDALLRRAEDAFERAARQSLQAQEAEFRRLAETILTDLATAVITQILSGVERSNAGRGPSAGDLSSAIARAAAKGGRFL